jgi:MerR family redox-sensitive transcriptional activator SoxR
MDLAIGEVANRAGIAPSALRFYEKEGLIHAERSDGGQRRYHRDVLRLIAFIRAAQRVGLSLDDIRDALHTLPEGKVPTAADWARLSKGWRPLLDRRIEEMQRLRDRLDSCIGCGCLSLKTCALSNPNDIASAEGAGARWLIVDDD